jgi:hypothetical protein
MERKLKKGENAKRDAESISWIFLPQEKEPCLTTPTHIHTGGGDDARTKGGGEGLLWGEGTGSQGGEGRMGESIAYLNQSLRDLPP